MFINMKSALCCATVLAGIAAPGLAPAASTAFGPQIVGKPNAGAQVAFDVVLPLRNRDKLDALLTALHDPASPQFHHWLSPQQFGLRFGPDSASVERVAGALRARGFTVTAQTRSLHVTGTAAQIERSFGTHLLLARADSKRSHVVTDSALKMPRELAQEGAEIFSFSPNVAHPMSRVVTGPLSVKSRRGADGGYWFTDLKQAYSYPSYQASVTVGGKTQKLDGTGATIGVLMDSDILDSDVQLNWTATYS